MKAIFKFLARVNKSFVPVIVKKGVPLAPQGAGSYYVRFTEDGKRVFKPLGKDLAQAFADLKNYELGREFEKRGVEMPVTLVAEQTSLALRVDTYLDEIKSNKARKTWQAYSNSLTYFKASCKRPSVQNVTREDMLAFKTFLRGQELSERAVYNNFLNMMVFLKWAGVVTKVQKGDWPSKVEREPEEYTSEEILAMLDAAENEERLLLRCFLFSGLRSGELAHLTYGDIDFKHSVWTVRSKDGWNVKTENSQRDVPVPVKLNGTILERMQATKRTKDDLVFTNIAGGANLHMLRVVKRVAKRAKITGRVDDHKFRSTAITLWLREGNSVQDVMRWVGHKDLTTILRYAAKVNVRTAETQRKAAGAFTKFATVSGD